MSDPDYDAEFEAFLKRRSPMHRRLSDFDHAEPSVDLDRLVLNRAREAIETPAQPPMFSTSRWAMPVALAATILIAFTVVLNVDHHPQKAAAPLKTSNVTASTVASDQAAPVAAELADSAYAAAEPPAAQSSAPAEERAPAPAPPEPAGLLAKRSALAGSNDATSFGETDSARLAPASVADTAAKPDATRADADSWLREIARLRAEGKNADADRELAAFRRAYPSHSGTSLAQPPTR